MGVASVSRSHPMKISACFIVYAPIENCDDVHLLVHVLVYHAPILSLMVFVLHDFTEAPIVYAQRGCNAQMLGEAKDSFLVVDRGECSFLQKARLAQNAGARALIVADNVDGDRLTQSKSSAIQTHMTIPSLFIFVFFSDICI